ncbi:hypothetical protein DJ568_03415 [Mucilaginibacter hurinus]|uniref:Ricin B lectin domain-containing protein n=1 Tax=Mucilaginibacter hurinus TaxID=2201324 RepID=A0A367GRU9_9SPHI|nr:RICIN domain-containing protein [Mucilaginibacter hurinus]RCH55818.1 hypothetical protein DJ568_03415 [Mucilaginibacter hurinus]
MRKEVLVLAAAASLLVMQGCKKNESLKTEQNSPNLRGSALTGAFNTYTITNAGSNKAIEVGGTLNQGHKMDPSRLLQQWTPATTPDRWQEWNIIDLGTGYYRIQNLFSGQTLAVPGGFSIQGLTLEQYPWLNDNAQQWQIILVSGTNYRIINRATGLAITNEAGSTTNGTAITQRTYVNNATQWWKINLLARDSYRDEAITNFFKRTSGSTAFDGVFSVPMTYGANNGKVMWPTNDTYWNSINSNGTTNCLGGEHQPIALRSSNLIQPAQSGGNWNWNPASTVNITTAAHGNQFFPIQSGTQWTWPSGGVEIGSHVYIYADEGNGLSVTAGAIYDINLGSLPTYTVTRLSTPAMSGQTAIRYMHGMVKHTDGYVYVYGNGSGWGAGDVYVARFLQSSPTTWTFWNGTSWAASPSTAAGAAIITGLPWGGFWVAKVNNKFVIASMDFGFGCDITQRDVYTRFSSDPKTGWSAQKKVYSLPDYKQGHTPTYYAPAIHPQFSSNSEMVFTYCVNFYGKNDGTNATCLPACSNPDGSMDPNDYRAKAVRIPYALIGI